jgi:hypothetical protein
MTKTKSTRGAISGAMLRRCNPRDMFKVPANIVSTASRSSGSARFFNATRNQMVRTMAVEDSRKSEKMKHDLNPLPLRQRTGNRATLNEEATEK